MVLTLLGDPVRVRQRMILRDHLFILIHSDNGVVLNKLVQKRHRRCVIFHYWSCRTDSVKSSLLFLVLNPIALRKAKIVCSFGLSECNRVKCLYMYLAFLDLTLMSDLTCSF